MRTHDQSVQDQFNSRAQAYLSSPVHAEGPDLAHAKGLVGQAISATGQAIDVGCGAGHLSFAIAPGLARIVALDPSPNMLATVATAAATRSLKQIETRQGNAESLPFADSHFCLACTRYSAHHWTRLDRMRTPPERASIIRALQNEAPREVHEALAFEPDGSFTVRTGLFWARRKMD